MTLGHDFASNAYKYQGKFKSYVLSIVWCFEITKLSRDM